MPRFCIPVIWSSWVLFCIFILCLIKCVPERVRNSVCVLAGFKFMHVQESTLLAVDRESRVAETSL